MPDPRLRGAAVERNRGPILDVLRRHLPAAGLVLEIASGTGQHIVHFARALPDLAFQPSDPDPAARASIDAWVAEAQPCNVRPALALDAGTDDWPIGAVDAVLCINMAHIAPWATTVGLLRGAGSALRSGGLLYLYGPFRRAGRHTASSNAAFDRDLRRRDPAWGVRDLEAVTAQALGSGLTLAAVEPMPANNLSLIFRK